MKKIAILIFFIVIIILYHYFAYLGHYGYDDIEYAKIAVQILNCDFDFSNSFFFRFTIVFLTATSFSILGINDLAAALPSLLISTSILLIVFYILRKESMIILIFALILLVLNHWFLFYSDKIMPDIYITLSVISSVFFIYEYRFSNTKKHKLYALLLSFSLFFGFLSKGTILLIAPLLFYFFIIDLILKRYIKFWLYTILYSFVLLASYFSLFYFIKNDTFVMFKSLYNSSYLNLCSYDLQPNSELLKRISYQYFFMTIKQLIISSFPLVVVGLCCNNFKSLLKFENKYIFFSISAIILFLSGNFMSFSLKHYIPMCPDPRHYLFIAPVFAVSAALNLKNIFNFKNKYIIFLFFSLIICIISYYVDLIIFKNIYLPLFIIAMLIGLFKKWNKISIIAYCIIFAFILINNEIEMLKYAQKINYSAQKEIVTRELLNVNSNCNIITDAAQINFCNYFLQFDNSKNINFIDYNYLKNSNFAEPSYLLLNRYTQYLSKSENVPSIIEAAKLSSKLIFEDNYLGIQIFFIKKFPSYKIIYETLNDFDNNKPNNWKLGSIQTTNLYKSSGQYSNIFTEYSATFEIEIDSLLCSAQNLLIISKLQYLTEKENNCKLIVSIEKGKSMYIWKSFEIKPFIKAYGNWCEANIDMTIEAEKILPKSKLIVYLWKTDKTVSYIDDFFIQIHSLDLNN